MLMRNINEIFRNIRQTHGYAVFLMLFVCIAGYGAFLFNAPIYDFMNQFFPCRYFTTECIRNGIFPLWNPYQSMGTPIHSDPQAGIFYLPMWIFAFCGKYTSTFCGIEFIFHTFIGAVGFYLLAWHFTNNRQASLISGCCYALSGFFIGNAQHLVWIVAAAWIPWIIVASCSLLENPSWKTALLLPIPLSLMVSGGYPGAYFILFYLILILFATYMIRAAFQRNWTYLRKILFNGLFTALLTFILCAPTLISYLEIKPLISRGSQLSIEQITQTFTIPSLISLIFPYLSVSDASFIQTDISMANVYMGLFIIPFAIRGVLKNRNLSVWIIALFGLISLIMAFGTQTGLYRLLFQHIPLISFIRLPSLFRVFFIVSELLLAAIGVQNLLENPSERRTFIRLTGIIFFSCFLITAIALSISSKNVFPLTNWKEGGASQKCFVEACIAATISLLLFLSSYVKKKAISNIFLIAVLLSDIVLQANLCGPKTIYDTEKDHVQMAKATSITGYPIPQGTLDCVDIIHKHEAWGFWKNVGPFFREVEWCSLNPVKLHSFSKMLNFYLPNETPLKMPLAFCPTVVAYDTSSHWLNSDTSYTSDPFLASTYNPSAQCKLQCFEPGHIIIEITADTTRPVVLCQNYYKGWHATLDGKQSLDIVPANFAMMSLYVPQGKHTIELNYKRPFYIWAFALQAALSVIVTIILVNLCRRRQHQDLIKQN